jgi:hypothetical protein
VNKNSTARINPEKIKIDQRRDSNRAQEQFCMLSKPQTYHQEPSLGENDISKEEIYSKNHPGNKCAEIESDITSLYSERVIEGGLILMQRNLHDEMANKLEYAGHKIGNFVSGETKCEEHPVLNYSSKKNGDGDFDSEMNRDQAADQLLVKTLEYFRRQ